MIKASPSGRASLFTDGIDILISAIREHDKRLLNHASFNYHELNWHLKLCWPRQRVVCLVDADPLDLSGPRLLLQYWNVLEFTSAAVKQRPRECVAMIEKALSDNQWRPDVNVESSALTIITGVVVRNSVNWKVKRTAYCSFAIPVNYHYRETSTQITHTVTTWYTVECRGTLADKCINQLGAGSIVRCVGRIHSRPYMVEDGELACELTLSADTVDILYSGTHDDDLQVQG